MAVVFLWPFLPWSTYDILLSRDDVWYDAGWSCPLSKSITTIGKHSTVGRSVQHSIVGRSVQHSIVGRSVQHSIVGRSVQHSIVGRSVQVTT